MMRLRPWIAVPAAVGPLFLVERFGQAPYAWVTSKTQPAADCQRISLLGRMASPAAADLSRSQRVLFASKPRQHLLSGRERRGELCGDTQFHKRHEAPVSTMPFAVRVHAKPAIWFLARQECAYVRASHYGPLSPFCLLG